MSFMMIPQNHPLWPQVIKFTHCVHIVFVTGKYTDIFQEREDIFCRWIFCGENFPLGWKFPGLSFPGEILHGGNSPEFAYEDRLICLTFSLATPFYLWRCFGGIVPGKFSAELEFSRGFWRGRGNFPREKFYTG